MNIPFEATYGALLAGGGGLAYAVRSPRCGWIAPSVWQGPRTRKEIAITFDDGPSESTPRLLEMLSAHDARCTFFHIGRHVERLPEVAREVVGRGHEVGNHTQSHSPLYLRHPQFVRDEITAAQQTFQQVLGIGSRWFRPPYGARWFGLREAQRDCGLTTVMWSRLARDWTLDAAGIARRLLGDIRPGAIWCLHDGRELTEQPAIENTLDALRRVLPEIRERGYRLVTVDALMRGLAADSN